MQRLKRKAISLGYAKLYFGENNVNLVVTGQFLYIQLPTAYVDNTYGNQRQLGPALIRSQTSLWATRRPLSFWANGNVNTLTMDYLTNCAYPCSYESGGGGSGASGGAGSPGPARVRLHTTTAHLRDPRGETVTEIATSLEYNLTNGFAGATTELGIVQVRTLTGSRKWATRFSLRPEPSMRRIG